jgi:hypothetical protein
MKPIRYRANENGSFEGLPEAAAKDGVVLHENFAALVRENRELRKQLKKSSPLKLFMIRLQNGNSVVLQAKTRDEALDFAGVTTQAKDVRKVGANGKWENAATTPEQLSALQSEMLEMGIGPQGHNIRELKDYKCDFALTDKGEFESDVSTEKAFNEFMRDYPELTKAELAAGDCVDHQAWETYTHPQYGVCRKKSSREVELLSEGVYKERTRLAPPSGGLFCVKSKISNIG